MRRQELIECVASNVLHLLLMPTEACNFRCVYCYEDFRLGRMHPDVVAGVKNFLNRRASGLDFLTLSWFGGEPLLALDIVEDVMQHAGALRRCFPQLSVSSEITTNAYTLSRSVFERLIEHRVTGYQISFDGPRSYHDRKRVRANGAGSFDRIWSNVLAMRTVPHEFSITLRLHVDAENYEAMPDFIDELALALDHDARFQIYVRPLGRFGGPNDADLPLLENETEGRVLEDLRRHIHSRGLRSHVPEDVTAICYAARGNSFVVRADGRLNKCTLALEHPRNQVGRILPDGRLRLVATKMEKWMRGLVSGDPGELSCPMLGYADPRPSPPRAGIRLPLAS